jgi:hypothetical protein
VSTCTPLSRRGLLQGVALTGVGAALGGCGVRPDDRTRHVVARRLHGQPVAGSSTTGSRADVRLLRAAIADEHALLLTCLSSMHGRPRLKPVLAPLVSQQRAHVAALRAALTDAGRRPRSTPRRFRGNRDDALRRVQSALVDAQASRRADALAASSGLLARLLASVSASHAVAAAQGSLRP